MFWEPFKRIQNKKKKKSFLPYALKRVVNHPCHPLRNYPWHRSPPQQAPPSGETLACRQDAWQKWECIGTFLCSATPSSHNGLSVITKYSLWSYARCQLITRQPQADTINCTYPLPPLHIDKNQQDDLPDPTLPHPKACTIWLLFWENR